MTEPKPYHTLTDAELYHHELPQYRAKVIKLTGERNAALLQLRFAIHTIDELVVHPELADDEEWMETLERIRSRYNEILK